MIQSLVSDGETPCFTLRLVTRSRRSRSARRTTSDLVTAAPTCNARPAELSQARVRSNEEMSAFVWTAYVDARIECQKSVKKVSLTHIYIYIRNFHKS